MRCVKETTLPALQGRARIAWKLSGDLNISDNGFEPLSPAIDGERDMPLSEQNAQWWD